MSEKRINFDGIDEIITKYTNKFNSDPYNISYWDSSEDFKNKLSPFFKPVFQSSYYDYNFTYLIPEKLTLLKKLGFDPILKDCILTTNSTISITLVLHWLNAMGKNSISIICPAYFSVIHNCQAFNMKYRFINYPINCSERIDIDEKSKSEVFWFTNPVYLTGKNLNRNDISLIESLIENNIVIVDESLVASSKELSHKLGNHPNFIGIYSPHKGVCVNGIKFSLFVFNHSEEPFFDKSVDYISGGLNMASISAIHHYLSDNWVQYSKSFYQEITQTHEFIFQLSKKSPGINYSPNLDSYLTSIYIPKIDARLENNSEFLSEIVEKSGTIFYPGSLNYFPKNVGFSFRINLTRDCNSFRSSLTRLLTVMSQLRE